MRHGESLNNELQKLNQELYLEKRTYDPDLSQRGADNTVIFGNKLRELGVEISHIYTSPFIRSLHSAKLLKKAYGNEGMPIKLMVSLFEKGGCQMRGQCYPGLSIQQARQIVPELEIDEKNEILIDENGWYKKPQIETTEECIARGKEVIRSFKEVYKSNPH